MRNRLNSEADTIDYAMEYANSLRPGDVVALAGDLGAGKSVFARGLMRGLGVTDEAMPSPTFSLIQEYQGKNCRVAHMDWYRLENPEEIEMLGVREYFQPPWICLIEWPERAPGLLPDATTEVLLEYVDDDPDARLVEINRREKGKRPL